MILRQCKNCGNTGKLRMISAVETENTLTQVYFCTNCGYLETVTWEKKGEAIGWAGNKIEDKKMFEFTVEHKYTKMIKRIEGENLADALKKNGLLPSLWFTIQVCEI